MFFSPPVPSLKASEVATLQGDDPDAIALLDVRSDEERAITHIEGVHIPLYELPNRLDELHAYDGRRLVVYCRTGHRSASVVAWLRARGFENAFNLDGGLHAWHRDVDRTVRVY